MSPQRDYILKALPAGIPVWTFVGLQWDYILKAISAPTVSSNLMSMPAMHHTANNTPHVVNYGSFHSGGSQFLQVDGSVSFISDSINYDTYRRLGMRDDGEVVGEY